MNEAAEGFGFIIGVALGLGFLAYAILGALARAAGALRAPAPLEETTEEEPLSEPEATEEPEPSTSTEGREFFACWDCSGLMRQHGPNFVCEECGMLATAEVCERMQPRIFGR